MPTIQKNAIPEIGSPAGLPHAADMEQAVLGSMLIEDEAAYTALEMLEPEDFHAPARQHIFATLRELINGRQSWDMLSLENKLRDRSLLETCGGPGYLSELPRSVGSAANIAYYAQVVSEKAAKRNLIAACNAITTQAYDKSSDTYEVLDEAADRIFELIHVENKNNTREASDYISEAYQQIINVQGAPDGITGIGSGTDLDDLTAGWQDTEFIVIAARPSMGKTAFVLKAMKHAAREHGAAGIISLEMSSAGLGKRLLVSEAGIDGQRARRGMLKDHEIEKLNAAAEDLQDVGLIIDDTTFVSAAKLRAKARAMIHKYDVKVLAIDYVQLLTSDKDNREQQVAEVSRTCKAIAKQYNIPVLGLSQLNRSCESRIGWKKRPQLSDLRESGAIEQDADLVAFLFRPEYYDLKEYPQEGYGRWTGKGTQHICEMIIGKNRNGPTGLKRLGFDKQQARFYNLAPEPDERLKDAMDRAKNQYDQFNEKSPF